ncbi:peptide/nickel transport system permease protein/oligopeptide transport system permease protein [Actinomadura hallensis]|uniref:Peptide/nickel transport system permease protein/oligopeptide transport system permease protein n=1 Tax=Actinomadura hallensis TaxID=337895 RepID=A0A543IFP6_9ACTN|nr:ABC transporter permease [Actinomadura hallensis]TQM69377.1 peptide/nickel transport system permease protein/oligopeptide transport system permease protein [Actinomadura hallensis]HLV74479.1 ABC transporter permease [Vulgatibacteraceae bacterium]
MAAPIEVSGSDAEAQPEAVLSGVDRKKIQGRSLGQIAWMRLKRDKVALTGGVTVILLILMAIFAPVIVKLFGHPPNEFHQELIDPTLGGPLEPRGGMSKEFLLGLEPGNGRDLFSRIVYGARVSLLVGFLATLIAMVIGTTLGVVAGYFGGWVDWVIARTMDVFLAFPLVMFAIAVVGVLPDSWLGLEGNGLRMAIVIFVIGFFSWPYMGRIVRGQTISLREREFVDAARSMGARSPSILFREILPNLVAPVLVYATLLIPTNILFEAALSFLGVGINPPTPAWGSMLTQAIRSYQIAPYFVIIPGVAIFVTVMAFNLFGDGLRDALDPRTGR